MALINAVEYLKMHGLYVNESNEDFVVRMLKGGFEEQMGMTFEEFCRIRNEILQTNPEKLI